MDQGSNDLASESFVMVDTFQSICAHIVRIDRERIVRIQFRSTNEQCVRSVTAYCTLCGVVLSPEMPDAFVTEEQRKEDALVEEMRAGAHPLIGKDGNADSLGLPTWEDLGGLLPLAFVPRRALFEEYEKIPRAQLRGRIRNLLGLSRSGKRRLDVPENFSPVYVGDDFIDHILNPAYPHRQGGGHLQPITLIAQTVAVPWESWNRRVTPENDKPSIAFLAAYQVGLSIRNHLVLVSRRSRVLTAYFLASSGLVKKERDGVILSLAWANPVPSGPRFSQSKKPLG